MREQSDRSFKARTELEAAKLVGCYYCCKTYKHTLIKEWVDSFETAICPKCGIDSVVPFSSSLDGSVEEFKEKLKDWNKESF